MIRSVLYCRISSLDQRTDRQRTNEKDFDVVIEDKVSGSVPFFEREGAKIAGCQLTLELNPTTGN